MFNEFTGRLEKKVRSASSLIQPDDGSDVQLAGLLSGTRVATPMGWSPVQTISIGDEVLTFDSGLKRVDDIEWIRLWDGKGTCPKNLWPITIPAGIFGNTKALQVLPGQNILVESDAAEKLMGDPFALIPAHAAEGLEGFERTPPEHAYFVVLLYFEKSQVIYSQNGALLYCPAIADSASEAEDTYTFLPLKKAQFLAAHLIEHESAACTYHPQGFRAAAVPA